MLGPLVEQYRFKGFQMGWILFHIPFIWDEDKEMVYSTCTTVYMYTLKKLQPEFTPFYMLGMIITAEMVLPPAFQFCIIKAREDILSFPLEFMDYARGFQKKFVHPQEIARQKSKKHDKEGIFMASLFYLGLFIVGMIGLIVLLNPNMPLLMAYYLNFPHWSVQLGFAIVQAQFVTYICLTWYGNQFIYAFPGIEYSFGVLYMLKEMKLGRNRYTTFETLRIPEVFIRNYRILQILHAKAMSLYSGIVLPVHQWCYLITASYCIYCSLELKGLIAVATMAGAFIILYWLLVAFTVFATIHSESQAVLNTWKVRKHDIWVQKTLKTLRPIKIQLGEYCFCDYSMVVTMFKSICEGAVDLIMVANKDNVFKIVSQLDKSQDFKKTFYSNGVLTYGALVENDLKYGLGQ